jgi:23S rRNA (adenine2030-N6)-methyltransferase
MFILNPPYTLEPLLRQVMPYLVHVLGSDSGATYTIEKGTQVTGAAVNRVAPGGGPRVPVGNARKASPLSGTGSLRLPGQAFAGREAGELPAKRGAAAAGAVGERPARQAGERKEPGARAGGARQEPGARAGGERKEFVTRAGGERREPGPRAAGERKEGAPRIAGPRQENAPRQARNRTGGRRP